MLISLCTLFFFFFSSRRRHTRFKCDWSSDVCSSDLHVQERMDGFELDMYESGLHQNGQFVPLIVKETLKAVETFHQAFWWRRNERRVPRTASTDPVLRPAKFARRFVRASSAPEENGVNFVNQTEGKGKSAPETSQTMLHGSYIVRDFLNILDRLL